MERTKISIQEEINVINAFGVGMGTTLIILVLFVYFKKDPLNIIYPLLIGFIYIFIRSLYLKRKLKRGS